MVIKMPSIFNSVLSLLCTILMVFNNLPKPSNAKNSVCTGTTTLSAAVKALTVINPSDGEQSITIKSYSSRMGSNIFFKTVSRLG